MNYCNRISGFSRTVYHFLSETFSYRLGFSELGLTDHFILELTRFSSFSPRTSAVEIYKMPSKVEAVYGNDIDLFIQNSKGTYNWYALQAKVMSFNGAFRDLKVKRGAKKQQWDMLLLHEHTFGSRTFYLLYSGLSKKPPVTAPTRRDCLGIPTIEEYGLGIVETKIIAAVRTTILRKSQLFYFKEVFPDYIDSIRMLFCCPDTLPLTSKQFKRSDIDTRGYHLIYAGDSNEGNESQNEKGLITLENGKAPTRVIINLQS